MIDVITLNAVVDNPFRNRELLPISEEDIAEIRESIESTDLWQPLVVRQKEGTDEYELAFGHTRLEALRRVNSNGAEKEFEVKELTDEQMLKMLVDENRTQRVYPPDVQDHDVLQVLRAVARGVTEFTSSVPATTARDKLRSMGDYLDPEDLPEGGEDAGGDDAQGVRRDQFIAKQVAEWMGLRPDSVGESLSRLKLRCQGILDHSATRGLSSYGARMLVNEVNRFVRERTAELDEERDGGADEVRDPTQALDPQVCEEAKKFAAALTKVAHVPGTTGNSLVDDAVSIRDKMFGEQSKPTRSSTPNLNQKAGQLRRKLKSLAKEDDQPPEPIAQASQLSAEARQGLAAVIRQVKEFVERWLAVLNAAEEAGPSEGGEAAPSAVQEGSTPGQDGTEEALPESAAPEDTAPDGVEPAQDETVEPGEDAVEPAEALTE